MPANPNGNKPKHYSYKAAWGRISAAQGHGFHLEAVTLVESIITDRLISFLVKAGFIERQTELFEYPPLSQLIRIWKRKYPDPIVTKHVDGLQKALDEWRQHRNHVVHGIVKSHPGTVTGPVEDFLEAAKRTAAEGVVIAKCLSNWIDRERRSLRKVKNAVTDQV